MVPSNFKKLDFLESGRDSKQLFKKYAAERATYSHHYKLRTSPDDWWFCVIKEIAEAIERSAQQESARKMFVDHEGKRNIEVAVDDPTIYRVNYSWLFDQITKGIEENVKVPEFVDGMTGDFGTTTPVQKIVSQITLMFSMKEYFEFELLLECGIPAVEMLGSEEDRRELTSKLKVLRTLLEPIENDLHVRSNCFYPTGSNLIGGWITNFLEGAREDDLLELFEHKDFSTGLVTVPLILKHPSGAQDTAALVGGMLGFTVHRTDTSDEVTVQPFQGWALMLANDSPFL
ncbi:Uncharacterized protein P5673_026052 [Acropora cervicornis]|uniref:Uncharacterized protein n=1 Tax=Acropora cervicornis TaxID=6130 RepID=A0AAD9Q125_ACRCE|nr:Uncharacterized protein P5673_026052 [Acropora cervicornis]